MSKSLSVEAPCSHGAIFETGRPDRPCPLWWQPCRLRTRIVTYITGSTESRACPSRSGDFPVAVFEMPARRSTPLLGFPIFSVRRLTQTPLPLANRLAKVSPHQISVAATTFARNAATFVVAAVSAADQAPLLI